MVLSFFWARFRTINNVEEHIRLAVLSELANPNSVFKNIRVDPDTIEIKRLLDQEVLKTAFLTKEEVRKYGISVNSFCVEAFSQNAY